MKLKTRLYKCALCLTGRQWLILLNLIVLVFSVSLSAFCIWNSVIIYRNADFLDSEADDALYVTSIALAVLGLLLALCASMGITASHKVSLQMLVMYFWSNVLLLAPFLLFALFCFDFQPFYRAWIRHRWDSGTLRHLRRMFCPRLDGRETYNKECAAPLYGGFNYSSTAEWCEATLNSTECSWVQNKALDDCFNFASMLFDFIGATATVDILLCLVCLKLTYHIVTTSVIFKSMNDLINYMMVLPATGTIILGVDLMADEVTKVHRSIHVMGECCVVAGCLMAVLTVLGVIGGRMKDRSALKMHMGGMFFVVGLLGTVIIMSFVIYVRLPDIVQGQKTDQIACSADLVGCCCCSTTNDLESSCPEWDRDEVIVWVEVYLKIVGFAATMTCAFVLGGIYSTWVLFCALKHYKSDYI